MPGRERVKVKGVAEVQKALKALEAQSADLKAVHQRVAGELLPGVAQRSPRRSGALAASWSAGSTKTRARILSSRVYSGPIEYGWPGHGIEPAGMVRATVQAEQTAIVRTYEQEIAALAARDGLEVKR